MTATSKSTGHDVRWDEKPKKCCAMGTYKCAVPMFVNGRREGIDFCIVDLVAALNAANIITVASCCGHKQIPGSIILEDGRELIIVENAKERNKIFKIWKKK